MGLCASKHSANTIPVIPNTVSGVGKGPQINTPTEQQDIKLLLLGPGESGKSTIFRQMKLLHKGGFSQTERMAYVMLIRRHCVECFSDLITGANKLALLSEEDAASFNDLLHKADSAQLRAADAVEIQKAWQSQPLQLAYENRTRFQLADWAKHFFEEIVRIAGTDYVPTDEDILRCRIRTGGFTEMKFSIEDTNFRLVDVGGQRSERRKWIHCFENVHAVIYVAAISEYDQTIFEDNQTNRFLETVRLFNEICNTRYFSNTPVILFLNKRDLLERKLKNSPLHEYFPEYTGGDSLPRAISFLTDHFTSPTNPGRQMYVHVTCAVDTQDVGYVFSSVRDAVINETMQASGLV